MAGVVAVVVLCLRHLYVGGRSVGGGLLVGVIGGGRVGGVMGGRGLPLLCGALGGFRGGQGEGEEGEGGEELAGRNRVTASHIEITQIGHIAGYSHYTALRCSVVAYSTLIRIV